MNASGGLTLIELLATLLVLAIVAGIGVPTFQGLVLEIRMTTQVSQLSHAMHIARQTAHRTFQQAVVCKSGDGRQCDAQEWQDGWLVFVNADSDRPPRVDPGERILATGSSFPAGTISANRNHFVFNPFHLRSTNGTLTFCDGRGGNSARELIISYTGRTRVARTDQIVCPG